MSACCPLRHFFYGLKPGEEITVDIESGKTMIVKFLTISDAHPDGTRTLFFELERPAARSERPRSLPTRRRAQPSQGRCRRIPAMLARPPPA